jgi:hypothetical protein
VVAADGGGLPAGVVAGGVGGVELELAVLVVAGEEEGGAEGPGAADLRVVLLDVADVDDDFLDGDAGSVLDSVVLTRQLRTCAFSRRRLIR